LEAHVTTLWQINMGDGTWAVCCMAWAVCCMACRQPLFRGPKQQADRVFDSHTCTPAGAGG
jgi:hypothetical protein